MGRRNPVLIFRGRSPLLADSAGTAGRDFRRSPRFLKPGESKRSELLMNETNNETVEGKGSRVLSSGAYEGSRIRDLDPSDLEFEARRGCVNSADRCALRTYLSSLLGERRGYRGRTGSGKVS